MRKNYVAPFIRTVSFRIENGFGDSFHGTGPDSENDGLETLENVDGDESIFGTTIS